MPYGAIKGVVCMHEYEKKRTIFFKYNYCMENRYIFTILTKKVKYYLETIF